ncbi:hypothetical protein C8J57DRAFT_325337 [Mycena rebaudengoi]|nr:hypothetical protein C8J57DRAFT_325337 [Mycena rebaudengoi]
MHRACFSLVPSRAPACGRKARDLHSLQPSPPAAQLHIRSNAAPASVAPCRVAPGADASERERACLVAETMHLHADACASNRRGECTALLQVVTGRVCCVVRVMSSTNPCFPVSAFDPPSSSELLPLLDVSASWYSASFSSRASAQSSAPITARSSPCAPRPPPPPCSPRACSSSPWELRHSGSVAAVSSPSTSSCSPSVANATVWSCPIRCLRSVALLHREPHGLATLLAPPAIHVCVQIALACGVFLHAASSRAGRATSQPRSADCTLRNTRETCGVDAFRARFAQ